MWGNRVRINRMNGGFCDEIKRELIRNGNEGDTEAPLLAIEGYESSQRYVEENLRVGKY